MTHNPYAPPIAAVDSINTQPVRVYSPTQVACGTIGGPIGLVYFLRANFVALGDDGLAQKTLWLGGLCVVVLLFTLPMLPESVPSLPFTIAYIVIGRYVASEYQMTKQAIADSPMHEFQSNWRVLGIGLLCLIASLVVFIGPLLLLDYYGILTL